MGERSQNWAQVVLQWPLPAVASSLVAIASGAMVIAHSRYDHSAFAFDLRAGAESIEALVAHAEVEMIAIAGGQRSLYRPCDWQTQPLIAVQLALT